MKRFLATLCALLLLISSASVIAGGGTWKLGPFGPYWDENPWPEFTPMYWMEEFMNRLDSDEDRIQEWMWRNQYTRQPAATYPQSTYPQPYSYPAYPGSGGYPGGAAIPQGFAPPVAIPPTVVPQLVPQRGGQWNAAPRREMPAAPTMPGGMPGQQRMPAQPGIPDMGYGAAVPGPADAGQVPDFWTVPMAESVPAPGQSAPIPRRYSQPSSGGYSRSAPYNASPRSAYPQPAQRRNPGNQQRGTTPFDYPEFDGLPNLTPEEYSRMPPALQQQYEQAFNQAFSQYRARRSNAYNAQRQPSYSGAYKRQPQLRQGNLRPRLRR